MRIRANGLELWTEDRGDGPPVVLIMGIGAQHLYWPDRLVELLLEAGFRVIRFDNRDIGQSTWLDAMPVPPLGSTLARRLAGLPIPAPYTLRDMADDTIGLLDALGLDRAHLVGASMGGMIAQEAAIHHPSRVASLTSVMSSPGDLWNLVGQPAALRGLLQPIPRDEDQAADRGAAMFRILHGGPDDPAEEALAADIGRRAFRRGSHPRGFLRHFAAIQASGSRRAALAQLHLPVAVVHGKQDPLLPPRAGIATAQAIPNARLHLFDGMGHTLPAAILPDLTRVIAEVAGRA